MPTDRATDPWSGSTYNGFAGAPGSVRGGDPVPPARPGAQPPVRRRASRGLLIGGVAAAVIGGVAFGLLARPELDTGSKAGAPAVAAAPGPPSAGQVPIAVAPPPAPAVAPRAAGRLEVLPQEMAQAGRMTATPRAPQTTYLQPPSAAPAAPATPPQIVIAPPPAPAQNAPSPRYADDAGLPTPPQASFDCDSARPGAEQAICTDPQLAAADRRLARAYRRALRSGADPAALRQEQRDWLEIREDAAQRSRRALASVYAQREAELNDIAADGGRSDDDR
jgi:uncharacterized protein YecT (DUF1311 family)